MADIKLNSDDVKKYAADFKKVGAEMDDLINAMTKLRNRINSETKGNTFRSFLNLYEGMAPKFKEMQRVIENEYGFKLDKAADNFAEADRINSTSFGGGT